MASEGGSGTPVPDLSIEVDELEMVLQRVISADIHIEYGPVLEQWGGVVFIFAILLASLLMCCNINSH